MRTRRGFTLVEIIVALAVAAVFFSAVLPLLSKSITNNRAVQLKLYAYEAASREMENLREENVSSLVAPNHLTFPVTEIPESSGDIYITKELGDEKIASVRSVVSWTFNGKTESVELNTYLYGSTE